MPHISHTGRNAVIKYKCRCRVNGFVPAKFMLSGKEAIEQFVILAQVLNYSSFDFWCEVGANWVAVFLHYPFWVQRDFSLEGIPIGERDQVLAAIDVRWTQGISRWHISEIYNSV